ncbi:hypothetical protein [Paraburkholderia sp. BCC1884]|uniref:hypothetical protein n=1 Tax=Paraburkholderia sp. BCC1884 TaxID=2562668 RepID=UPI00118234D8|nr:hypothetical protein [Paraburkholderia sp. BCC1884]
MKSRVINSLRAIGQRLPRAFSLGSPVSRSGLVLSSAACVLALSGCYYPYGYYPGGYYPYYATVPAGATQQAVPVGPGPADQYGAQQDPQQGQAQPQAQAQYQQAQPNPPATYAVAAPPVYAAPVYPAYYPPPLYPAYYGYPGWYGPSVSIGFGFGGYWGGGHGGGGWGGGGHGGGGHWH